MACPSCGKKFHSILNHCVTSAKTVVFVCCANKSLYHPHSSQILKHNRIQCVYPFLYIHKSAVCAFDYKIKHSNNYWSEDKEHKGKFRAGENRHNHAAHHNEWYLHHEMEAEKYSFLYLGNIVGQTGNKLSGFDFIKITKRERLHLAK